MSDEPKDVCNQKDGELDGAFVESAFTVVEVEQAIKEEKRQGVDDDSCAFLGNIRPSE